MWSMSGYTKLFSSIIGSTIWREDNDTRLLWITMLAMADKDGIVEASVPGLADFARIPIEATRVALSKLMSPDPDSRSTEYEGRRVEVIDGGWRLLNHAKYRAKLSDIERREYKRQKQEEYRRRGQRVDTCGQYDRNVDSVDTSRSKSRVQKQNVPPPPPKGEDGFEDFWADYPRKVGKGDALKAWRTLKPSADLQAVIAEAVAAQRTCRQWLKDGGQFIPHPATWLGQRRWEDAPDEGLSLPPPGSASQMVYRAPWCRHIPKCGSDARHEMLLAQGVLEVSDAE